MLVRTCVFCGASALGAAAEGRSGEMLMVVVVVVVSHGDLRGVREGLELRAKLILLCRVIGPALVGVLLFPFGVWGACACFGGVVVLSS